MLRHELAVEEREVARPEPGDQPGERNLRCIGRAAEHAFTEKGASELYAIKAADKRFALPYLYRVGVPRGVKREHRAFELVVDPCFLTVGAGCDDLWKASVVSDREPARP